MLIWRIISALIGIPLAMVLIYLGGVPLLSALLVLAVGAQLELKRILAGAKMEYSLVYGFFCTLLFFGLGLNQVALDLLLLAALFAALLFYLAIYPRWQIETATMNYVGAVYTTLFFVLLYELRNYDHGVFIVIFLFVCNWATDTFAYFVGMSIGKHKLAPIVSPKKTWEGSIGGFCGGVLAAVVLANYAPQGFAYYWVGLGAIIGVMGQIGDLFESALKRYGGVKDSGHIIPGHGGILDRFDSVLFTAPLVYYYLRLLA